MADLNDGLLGSFAAVKKIGISLERLRYWENLGIIKPNYVQCGTRRFKRYSQEDINRAVLVKMLTSAASSGEAKYFMSKKYLIAGKTGTAP